MKKILSLLSIIALTLGTAPTATAQYTVMTSTDAVEGGDQAVRYEYNIYDWGGKALHELGLGVGNNANYINRTGTKAINFIFKANDKSEYDIYATNSIVGDNKSYIDALLTYDASSYILSVTSNSNPTLSVCFSEHGIIADNESNEGINIRVRVTDDNVYYEWQADNNGTKLSTVKKQKAANHTVGPWKNFYIKPAAPAPMIFSKSAKYEGKLYATYSTGVAATIPDGVTAYTATYNAMEGKLTLSEVSGTTIPVNTGVLLALDANTTNANITVNGNGKTVVYPEKSTETTTLESTGFQPSCTSSNNTGPLTVASEEGSTAYILGVGKTHGLGFYKLSDENRTMDCYKAYLKVTSPTSEEAIKLEFPNSTGISTATTGTKAGTPVYDLSGRKVTKTSKGNIYIQNGKKLLAK